MQARPNISDELRELSNHEWKRIIDDYIKSDIDRQIAKMYYLDGIPQVDIGAEIGYSRSAIKKRLPKILNTIEKYHKKTKD